MTNPTCRFVQLSSDGTRSEIARVIPVEQAIAIEFNGIGYAVMMATPADLEDFAYGFALAERLIDGLRDVLDVSTHQTPDGIIARISIQQNLTGRIAKRVRHRATDASCGLCGIENLEQAMRPLQKQEKAELPEDAVFFAALAGLRDFQPLNAETGAVHVAALCSAGGRIRLAREDVGRHNAFDKLIGAMAREELDWDGGFALLSARCSYELVEKASVANCPTLVTISAPTSLALERAKAAGLNLVVLARSDSVLFAS
ncbi:formate dehydrogenase accessory sulfurtransferase FdhD [Parasphingopyxis lamellibrachiae]|nr:formate dehydrogenase accessory sulfurtransferase FdhD [Parasphingopyxis lamellibrachiae]